MNWIGHVNRMDSKGEVSHVFNNNHQESRLRGRPQYRWWNCIQTDINIAELKIGKTGQKTELTARVTLRR